MSIPMPPLPRHDKVYSNRWGDGSDATYWYSLETLRARDLEVARMVLEAAANVCDEQRGNWSIEGVGQVALQNAETAIRALEFKHHE